MSKHNGGPAFPRPASEFTKNGTLPDGNDAEPAQVGISIRDYFAAKAMQGELSSQGESVGTWPDRHVTALAERCYLIADAMLAAREKGGAT